MLKLSLRDPTAAVKRLSTIPEARRTLAPASKPERVVSVDTTPPPEVRHGPKRPNRHAMLKARRFLVESFPKCFQPFGQPKKPLKIGIRDDIFARMTPIPLPCTPYVPNRYILQAALADYTRGVNYLRAMVAGAERIDLDGNPAGIVDEDQAKFAAECLAQLEASP